MFHIAVGSHPDPYNSPPWEVRRLPPEGLNYFTNNNATANINNINNISSSNTNSLTSLRTVLDGINVAFLTDHHHYHHHQQQIKTAAASSASSINIPADSPSLNPSSLSVSSSTTFLPRIFRERAFRKKSLVPVIPTPFTSVVLPVVNHDVQQQHDKSSKDNNQNSAIINDFLLSSQRTREEDDEQQQEQNTSNAAKNNNNNKKKTITTNENNNTKSTNKQQQHPQTFLLSQVISKILVLLDDGFFEDGSETEAPRRKHATFLRKFRETSTQPRPLIDVTILLPPTSSTKRNRNVSSIVVLFDFRPFDQLTRWVKEMNNTSVSNNISSKNNSAEENNINSEQQQYYLSATDASIDFMWHVNSRSRILAKQTFEMITTSTNKNKNNNNDNGNNQKIFYYSTIPNDGRCAVAFPCDLRPSSATGRHRIEHLQDDFFELPSCLCCLDRLESTTTGITRELCSCPAGRCNCLMISAAAGCQNCRHVLLQQQIIHHNTNNSSSSSSALQCNSCDSNAIDDLWSCCVCGTVGCSRYRGQHAKRHYEFSGHEFSLNLSTQQVWDYATDEFVHRWIAKTIQHSSSNNNNNNNNKMTDEASTSSSKVPARQKLSQNKARNSPTPPMTPSSMLSRLTDSHCLGDDDANVLPDGKTSSSTRILTTPNDDQKGSIVEKLKLPDQEVLMLPSSSTAIGGESNSNNTKDPSSSSHHNSPTTASSASTNFPNLSSNSNINNSSSRQGSTTQFLSSSSSAGAPAAVAADSTSLKKEDFNNDEIQTVSENANRDHDNSNHQFASIAKPSPSSGDDTTSTAINKDLANKNDNSLSSSSIPNELLALKKQAGLLDEGGDSSSFLMHQYYYYQQNTNTDHATNSGVAVKYLVDAKMDAKSEKLCNEYSRQLMIQLGNNRNRLKTEYLKLKNQLGNNNITLNSLHDDNDESNNFHRGGGASGSLSNNSASMSRESTPINNATSSAHNNNKVSSSSSAAAAAASTPIIANPPSSLKINHENKIKRLESQTKKSKQLQQQQKQKSSNTTATSHNHNDDDDEDNNDDADRHSVFTTTTTTTSSSHHHHRQNNSSNKNNTLSINKTNNHLFGGASSASSAVAASSSSSRNKNNNNNNNHNIENENQFLIGNNDSSIEYLATFHEYRHALSTFEKDSAKLSQLKSEAKKAETDATELHSSVKRSMEVKHAYDSQLKDRIKNLKESIEDMRQNVEYRKKLVKQGFVAGAAQADNAVIFTSGGGGGNNNNSTSGGGGRGGRGGQRRR